mmetsp:Transcript_69496/g.153337  ORF Transcript_69496/g.153337 Transcript_69496/m.153337 type:complete len:153 (+) Transcript_69496:140-598(+)
MAQWLEMITLKVASENPANTHAQMRAAVFVNLVTMRKVMDHGGNGHVQLAPCNLEILQKSNYLFHSAHNWLAMESLEANKLLWKSRPKHKLDHLVYDVAPQTNPIKLSCYMDEDAVGKLKKLAMASSPQNMGEYVLSRYASYICVRWLRRME